MAMAKRDSVTVSIAAEISGKLKVIDLVRRVVSETSRGWTFEWAGTSKTSSKVSALAMSFTFLAPTKTALYAGRIGHALFRRPLLTGKSANLFIGAAFQPFIDIKNCFPNQLP